MADIDWQAQADLVRSGKLSPETVTLATGHQLDVLGRAGYMDLYPEVFKTFAPVYPPSARKGWWEEQRIHDLQALLEEYSGPEGSMIRWLIQNRIRELEYKVAAVRGITAARKPTPEPPPVPDWMKPYMGASVTMQPSRPGGRPQRREQETREVGTLSPLGAQAELTPEQMGEMAGYQAWTKAGAPTQFSEQALREMSDWERWWTPYTRLSQSLFPKQQRLASGWATARQ